MQTDDVDDVAGQSLRWQLWLPMYRNAQSDLSAGTNLERPGLSRSAASIAWSTVCSIRVANVADRAVTSDTPHAEAAPATASWPPGPGRRQRLLKSDLSVGSLCGPQ